MIMLLTATKRFTGTNDQRLQRKNRTQVHIYGWSTGRDSIASNKSGCWLGAFIQ
nr:hypothetical protein Q903MT_gene3571 [Picea sitchensis]